MGQYPGTAVDGGSEPVLRPARSLVPQPCGTGPPSCATCISKAFGCTLPGVCRDLGSQTFDCILSGA